MNEPKRILIIDDEESIRRGLRAYLEDEGLVVIEAVSGEEGLEMLAQSYVDAAIVDIRLPGIDGNIFIERAHASFPEIKFIIYTGSMVYKPPVNLQRIGVGEEYVFKKPGDDLSLIIGALKNLIDIGK